MATLPPWHVDDDPDDRFLTTAMTSTAYRYHSPEPKSQTGSRSSLDSTSTSTTRSTSKKTPFNTTPRSHRKTSFSFAANQDVESDLVPYPEVHFSRRPTQQQRVQIAKATAQRQNTELQHQVATARAMASATAMSERKAVAEQARAVAERVHYDGNGSVRRRDSRNTTPSSKSVSKYRTAAIVDAFGSGRKKRSGNVGGSRRGTGRGNGQAKLEFDRYSFHATTAASPSAGAGRPRRFFSNYVDAAGGHTYKVSEVDHRVITNRNLEARNTAPAPPEFKVVPRPDPNRRSVNSEHRYIWHKSNHKSCCQSIVLSIQSTTPHSPSRIRIRTRIIVVAIVGIGIAN